MKLERITLTDFRCFYGENVIDFAIDDEKNVTLIHAENGVGKTTLLNALLWCFYKDTTPRFERKGDIVNHQAVREGRNLASVAVEFSHNEELFEARRNFRLGDPSAQNRVQVAKIDFGSSVPETKNAPETFLNAVIPREMAGHFLFDGEHAETISGEANRAGVAHAIQDILGASVVKQAIKDLEAAHKYYAKHASDATKDKGVALLQKEIDDRETLIVQADAKIEEAESRLNAISQQSADITEKLRNAAEVKDLQTTKESLEREISAAKSRYSNSVASQQEWLKKKGRSLVATKLSKQSLECLEAETTKGKIPAPYNQDFVSTLLQSEQCVCGRPLKAGSMEATAVQQLLKTAASKEFQDRIIKVRSRIRQISESSQRECGKDLLNAQRQEVDENSRIHRLEGQLEEARKKIMNVDVAEIADRERKLRDLRREDGEKRDLIARQRHNISLYRAQIRERQTQIDAVTKASAESRRFLLRRDLSKSLHDRASASLAIELEEARDIINKLISKIIATTSRKSFEVNIGSDFSVSLTNVHGTEMAKSEGENQLLGLAFTAALCKFASLRKNAKSPMLLPGTEAPLVLDAPFGKLDSVYKVATAEFIPRMASQVILMVSKEQGSENVINVFKDKIGEEYCLISHNPNAQGEKASETINLRGNEIVLTEYNSAFEGTEIRRV